MRLRRSEAYFNQPIRCLVLYRESMWKTVTNGLLVEVILRRALLQCSSMRFPQGKLQGVDASGCIQVQVSHALTDEGTHRQPPIGAI
jgi:hypothetical protein